MGAQGGLSLSPEADFFAGEGEGKNRLHMMPDVAGSLHVAKCSFPYGRQPNYRKLIFALLWMREPDSTGSQPNKVTIVMRRLVMMG